MLSIALGAAALVFSPPAHAAVDQFMCIPGVTGTCTIPNSAAGGVLQRTNGWIAVTGVSLGFTNTAPSSDPYGPGVGSVGPLEVTKPVDDTSPTWFLYAVQGTPMEVRLATRKEGGVLTNIQPFFQARYEDVRLTVSQVQLTGDDAPQERLTFEGPSTITIQYWKQKSDGSLNMPPLAITWPTP